MTFRIKETESVEALAGRAHVQAAAVSRLQTSLVISELPFQCGTLGNRLQGEDSLSGIIIDVVL